MGQQATCGCFGRNLEEEAKSTPRQQALQTALLADGGLTPEPAPVEVGPPDLAACAAGAAAGSGARAGDDLQARLAAGTRHLVLHMDINKTVLMCDSAGGKDATQVVHEVIASTSWGVEVDGQWLLLEGSAPGVLRPEGDGSGDVLSYAEFIERKLPGRDNSKARKELVGVVCEDEQPGVLLRGHAERLRAGLKMPDGTDVGLLPAFFELLLALKAAGRSFALCFRSFGEDMDVVAEELNMFCEGRHPLFPGAVFDGRDGQPDYRISLSSPRQCGTFFRDDSGIKLVMGTIDQPGEGRFKHIPPSIDFYDSYSGVDVRSGSEAEIGEFVRGLTSASGTFALRDHFLHWKNKKQSSTAGKVFFFDASASTSTHDMFFDDNIRYSETHIVHPVEVNNPENQHWASSLLLTHLCRAEALEAISDRLYFVKEVVQREQHFERKLQARQKLARCMLKVKALRCFMTFSLDSERVEETYDPWRGLRKDDSQISVTTDEASPDGMY